MSHPPHCQRFSNCRKRLSFLLLFVAVSPLWAGDGTFGVELELWHTTAGIELDTIDDDVILYDIQYPDHSVIPTLSFIAGLGPTFVRLSHSQGADFSGTLDIKLPIIPEFIDLPPEFEPQSFEGLLKSKLERKDSDITIGYAWSIGLTTFAGFKFIEFQETFETNQLLVRTLWHIDQDTVVEVLLPGTEVRLQDGYEYFGPYLGLGYAYTFANKFSLEASLAFASLEGETGQILELNGEQVDLFFEEDLKASGFSFRFGGAYQINQKTSVALGYRGQAYLSADEGNTDLASDGWSLRLRYMF